MQVEAFFESKQKTLGKTDLVLLNVTLSVFEAKLIYTRTSADDGARIYWFLGVADVEVGQLPGLGLLFFCKE